MQTPETVAHVLIVDDEANVRRVLGTLLEQEGFTTARAASGEEALALVRTQDPDLVLTDLKMDGMNGMELLQQMQAAFPEIPVIMITAHGTVANAVDAMKRGAHDFMTKPFDRDEVIALVRKTLGHARRSRREFQGPLVPGQRCGLIGDTPSMVELKRTIEKVAPSPATVLILGETGTGKELVAEALHQLSPRSKAPLIKVNCGALPEALVESELLGHARGAFTGADRAKPGRFELADGGTLFLDEVGELPPAVQVKLLRVLEDGIVEPVGSTEPRRVDVRLVTATNRDLSVEVAEGRFREDLYFRLRVIEIAVPPLRERAGDVPALVDRFLDKHARRLERPRPEVGAEAIEGLMRQPWPGNVRELENAIERAILLAERSPLGPADLGLRPQAAPAGDASTLKGASQAAARETELRMIREALEATGSNVTQAADKLGLSRRGLQLKMKALGLR